jgi:multidrug resistance efflux pump
MAIRRSPSITDTPSAESVATIRVDSPREPPSFPALRGDLRISPQRTDEGTIFVIKDPIARRFFRFGEVEHFIARQLDGVTPLENIPQRLERELGVTAPAEVVQQFVEQLRRLGLIETGQPAACGHSHQRVRGNPLYIRLRAVDPDQLFNRIIGKIRFFFTRGFVVLSLLVVALALGVTMSSWDEIVRDLGRLYRFDALLLAWVTVLLVTTVHEFAHGLTCKHFGGEVHEIGFLLLYFQPAFYCNVSDAWLFAEKSKRLWVMFAGAFSEIFIWSLATLTWRVVEPDTRVSFLAMIVMATSGIKSLFNMNPLIKLDGYYLLSDYLEVPNLRQRSMAYLKAAIKRLWGSIDGAMSVTRRERRIYVIYGVLAAIYSTWLLSLVALRFGGFLVERYQGPGFLAFSGLLMVFFQNPLGRLTRRMPLAFRLTPEQRERMKRPAVRAGLLCVALLVLVFGRMELKVSGEFTVLPVRNADVHATVDGSIEQVYVEEGDRVREGDLLVRLSEREYRAELDKVEAQIAQKSAELKMLRAGPRQEEVGLTKDEIQTANTLHEHARRRLDEADGIHHTRLVKARATVNAAEERVQYARTDLTRLKALFAQGLISRKQLDEGQQEVALREKELEVAQAELQSVSADTLAGARQDFAVTDKQIQEASARLKLLLAGSRPETIEATQAEVARLETERRYLTEQLRLTRVVSPATGVVTTPKLIEKVGEHVKKGDLILKVYELKTVLPEVAISEKEIAEVKPGQKVVLKARAYPERSFTGRVRSVAPAGAVDETGLGRKVFRVTVVMDGASDLLKPEMTGNAKIFCGSRSIWHLLTRRIARYMRVEFWSWW